MMTATVPALALALTGAPAEGTDVRYAVRREELRQATAGARRRELARTAGHQGGRRRGIKERPVTAAVVTGLRGRPLGRHVPPQVIGRNLPPCHAHPRVFDGRDDGVPKVAAPGGVRAGLSMAAYDMKTRKMTARIPLPGGVRPAAAAWTGGDEATVRGSAGGKVHRVRVDVAEKTAEIVETFAEPGGAVYHPGG